MKTGQCFESRHNDNRFVSSAAFLHNKMKQTKPKLAFERDMSIDKFYNWQKQVRIKIKELMQFPKTPPQPEPRKLFESKRNGYILQKWELYPEEWSVVPFLVLIPDTVSESNPGGAVLCFPGSNGTKELLAGEPELSADIPPNAHPEHNKMALWYVQEGLIAIAIDNPVTGEVAHNPGQCGAERIAFNYYVLQMGRSYLGISVFQKLKVLEWAQKQEFIDQTRIAVSGHSLGTEPAMIIANLVPEVSAIIFNDFLCDFRKMAVASCLTTVAPWHIVPGLLEWFDFPDLLAACAPRPLIVCEGGPMVNLRKVQRAYQLMNAEGNFTFHFVPPYDNPSMRRDEIDELPEGLSEDEYLKHYANVNVKEHYFKRQFVMPWLKEIWNI